MPEIIIENITTLATIQLRPARFYYMKGKTLVMENWKSEENLTCFFDSHAHLDDEKFDEDREDIIQKIYSSGVTNFISAGYSLEGTKKALELANKYNFIYATAGISPNDIPQEEDKLWKTIDEIEGIVQKELENQGKDNSADMKANCNDKSKPSATNENAKAKSKLIAIGEIGLDYYWEKDEKRRELQRKACIKQIELANKYNLPIVIHVRDAIMDMLDILKNNEVKRKGVFHCCPQNRELIKEALKLGFYISFAGPITFKNSKNADEMINLVPNDKLLIETDSPYLAPEPVRGNRNTPINVKFVAEKVAKAKQISLEKVAEMTIKNAKQLFQI